MAFAAAACASVEKIARGRVMTKPEARISFRRKAAHAFVLKDKIADRVEDRLAPVDLDAERGMRAVPDKYVRARIDTLPREGGHKIRRLLEIDLGGSGHD